MRVRNTVAFFVLTCLSTSWADTIHLRNGTAIPVDQVSEKGDRIEYLIGATRYSIPRAEVSSIERTDRVPGNRVSSVPGQRDTFRVSISEAPAGTVTPGAHAAPISTPKADGTLRRNAAAKIPEVPGIDSAALLRRITNIGKIDEGALEKMESEADAPTIAAAYFLAAKNVYEHNDPEAARKYMKRCIWFAPDQSPMLDWYALLLIDAGEFSEAISQAGHAVQQAPESVNSLSVLGLAYYESGRFAEAIKIWGHAQQIHPSEAVGALLAKAVRESKVEGKFHEESDSAHFVLRYDGDHAGFSFRSDLLRTLDRQYDELKNDLGFAPDHSIVVILYTQQQFFDVTQAPAWATGANDGKLRIPVRDLSGMSPRLEAVLKHELTHSFVHSIPGVRCPNWLEEGLAQMEEARSISRAAELAELFRQGKAPLRQLEGSFEHLTPAQARDAYAEALATTDYLRTTYGMSALRRMLELVRAGEKPEAALNEVTHSNYSQLETHVAEYLQRPSW